MENKSQTRGLKPFVKEDSRINRTGRPRGFDEMRKLALRIACETVTLQNGRKMSVIEAMLRSWVCSKEPALQIKFMEIAFGKVPDRIEATGLENKPVLRLHFAHKLDDNGQLRPPRVPLPPDADGVHRRWRRNDDDGAPNGQDTRLPLLPDKRESRR